MLNHERAERSWRDHTARTARSSPMLRRWADGTISDVRLAIRSLARAPGFTATIVVTLALGFGANLAMFGILDAVFFRAPTGVQRAEDVSRVWTWRSFSDGPRFWSGLSYPQFTAIRATLGDEAETALYSLPRPTSFGNAALRAEGQVSRASATYFALLGTRPALGRFYADDEDRLGAGANVAVASYQFWRSRLGGDMSAIGRELLIGGKQYVLVGVAQEGFTGVELDATELWVPLASVAVAGTAAWWSNPKINGFQLLVRPRAGLRPGALEPRITAALRSLSAIARPSDTSTVARVSSIIRARGPGGRQAGVVVATRVAGVTLIVLIVACANVANLLLARSVRRRRETAVRLAMGISRPQLARLVLAESLVLATIAGVGALLVAHWGGTVLRQLFLPGVHWSRPPVDARLIGLAAAAAAVVALASGLLPALQATRAQLATALKAGGSDVHAHRSSVRATVLGVQAALSAVLLVGGALFIRSLTNVRDLRIGLDVERIVVGGDVRFDS